MAARAATEDGGEGLIATVQGLLDELHGGVGSMVVRLDSHLERDLGLDSLARVELVLRLERRFAVHFPEQALSEAETLRDLLRHIQTAEQQQQREQEPVSASLTAAPTVEASKQGIPETVATLLDALDWHLQVQPERPHIYLYDKDEAPTPITYYELWVAAGAVAAGLRLRGVGDGQAVALMLPTGQEFFAGFLGALLAGGIPVPMYPPVRATQLEDHLRRQAAILNNCQAVILLTVAEARPLAPLLKGLAPSLQALVTVAELMAEPLPGERPLLKSTDIALLQYTSGSTGNPKGVVLTHANLLANIRAMGAAVQASPDDVFVSWLPLYHDMGLIGAWLGSLYYGIPLVLMSPLTFLARPARWLWAIHRHKGTLSAGPNFAYELCAAKIAEEELSGLDLSSWRCAFNGAEQVSAHAIESFTARFAPYGFRPASLMPVYGLAECSVGLAFPSLGRVPYIDRVQREALVRDGVALPAPAEDGAALAFVGCGRALPQHALRVVDKGGRVIEEDRREGQLQFSGPSACGGYYRNPQATAALQQGEWLDSGDRAYLVSGELFITGRVKDVIIRGGHNIYPTEVEEVVGEIPGVRAGCVAAFGSRDPTSGADRLVVVAETRQRRAEALQELRAAVERTVSAVTGAPPDDIVLAPPRCILKTSSGKIRRDATRQRYERGTLTRGHGAPWRQIWHLSRTALWPWLQRGWRSSTSWLYAAWVWSWFTLLAIVTWTAVAVLPPLAWRQAVARYCTRLLARLIGVRLHVEGMDNLPPNGECIFAVNHASYLDAVILVALLPGVVRYVAKQELAAYSVLGFYLRRYGCEFVERFEVRRSVEDQRRMEATVQTGGSLLYFAEGTFGPAPGVRPFRMGAFIAAVKTGLPVVPIALRGTRALMPSGSWRPRHTAVTVTIGAPLRPAGTDWAAAVALRDAARAYIVTHSGEPPLTLG